MDRSLLVAGAAAACAVGLAVFAWPAAVEPPPIEVLASGARAAVTVHVSGAVVRPGLVTVDADARVADAIAAAGGASADAQLGALNLAAGLSDGSRVVVPGLSVQTDEMAGGRVRINAATADQLEGLPGVGPVLAVRIAEYRDANGPYEEVEDLLGVPGIGESKLAALRDAVVVP
ncbi:MAG: ComEA family DNA-binding protein [Thermodesulfobacteriota bacterium]